MDGEFTIEEKEAEAKYQEALSFLVNLTKFGVNFGLQRITHLLKQLGNPHQKLAVIHVGGTNGKGSTTAMVASILQEVGYRVGVFTSPHLHDYRERIVINGEMISKEEVCELLDDLRPHLEEMVACGLEHPTEFEVWTAMALLYFARKQVDFAVLEVGLGGAIDSTNVVHPLVAVITNVAMDHMDYLGRNIAEIATVKAGIIKEGSVVVTAADHPEALSVIRAKAASVNAQLVEVGRDVKWTVHRNTPAGLIFDVQGQSDAYPEISLPLSGLHQARNAACAIAVAEILKERYQVRIDKDHIYSGLRRVRWPGRLELLSTNPLILLDGAHNVDGAKALAEALPLYKRRRLVMCVGMLGDKEREKVGNILFPLADEVIITKPNSPRAGNWEVLAECAKRWGKPVRLIASPAEAAIEGVKCLRDGDLLCVTGSLYMLAEARAALIDYLAGRRE